jgi:hypothetical protein
LYSNKPNEEALPWLRDVKQHRVAADGDAQQLIIQRLTGLATLTAARRTKLNEKNRLIPETLEV